jgi:hypothetical protein
MTARLRLASVVAFWLALAFAVTMALLPHPPQLAEGIGDKWQHMAAFATLAALARFAWPTAAALRILERLSFVGALIEVFQSIPALHRDCDPLDWVADTAAAALVLAILHLARLPRN